LAWKSVSVLSVDGKVAIVRDQLSQTFKMDRTMMRAKAQPPMVGENWFVDRSYGNDWTFAMIINADITPLVPAVIPVADLAGRNAIQNPIAGQMALRMDSNYVDTFDGTIWRGSKLVPLAQPVPLLGWTSSQTTASNTTYTVASIAIPDPGWPYYIQGTAGMSISVTTADSGFSHNAAVMVDSTTIPTAPANNVVTYAFVGMSSQGFANAMPPWNRSQGLWTGAHTVNFIFRNGSFGTCAFGPLNTKAEWHFNIEILPA
jgi:hypothetical protein